MKKQIVLSNGETWSRINAREAKKRFIGGETLIVMSPNGDGRIRPETNTAGCRRGEFEHYRSFVKEFYARAN